MSAYGPLRCEHGALLVFRCELCKPLKPAPAPAFMPAPTPPPKVQIGPTDI